MIEAAGGVVWRVNAKGRVKLLVVHRPKYDDWTFPKGKALPGEEAVTCALREVAEETGFSCAVGPELAQSHYVDRKGRAKRVRYWAMTPIGGGFRSNAEVDEVAWLSISRVLDLLTYAHDAHIVASFMAALRADRRLSA